ncbi:MAG: M48 family metallopeptidase, partial [Ferruginibacter sp.]
MVIILFSGNIDAQKSSINFSPLGATQYQASITQLEKYTVPNKYTDKSAQAWYHEMMTDRNGALIRLFKDNAVVYDTILLNKCNRIASRIIAANKNYRFDSLKFYINRSCVPNAACYGEGTVMVNLGLFLWLDNDDELALVLAHEMSHQVLDHFQSRLEKNIAMLTSEGFKVELKDIKKSKDGKYERFKKLMKSVSTETGKHSTYKESEADSLAMVLIQHAGFSPINGPVILLKLDNSDAVFTSPTLYSLKDFFEKAPADQSFFIVKRKYNGLSSVTVTMNADKDFDSIKTHPDCIKRYELLAGNGPKPPVNCCTFLSAVYGTYKERAMLEIVRNLYESNTIGLCAHFCIFALKNNYDPAIYNLFLSLCFSELYWSDNHLQRFNAVNTKAQRET